MKLAKGMAMFALEALSKIGVANWSSLCKKQRRLEECLKAGHTYIIGYYNPSVRIINIVSHATSVVYVSFILKWRDLKFKVDSE